MPQYDTSGFSTDNFINTAKSFSLPEVWIIISVLLAVIGGILIYTNYLGSDKEDSYTGTKKFLYDFFNFKITIIEPIFRLLYIICTIALTLGSFSLIGTNFFGFIGVLVFGNVALRLSYEFILLVLNMFKNVSEINDKLGKKPKQTKEDKEKAKNNNE